MRALDSDTPSSDDDSRVQRALAALDTMANAWARGANVTRAVAVMLEHADREARLEAYIKQAFVEGAYGARHSFTPEDFERFARGNAA